MCFKSQLVLFNTQIPIEEYAALKATVELLQQQNTDLVRLLSDALRK